MAGGPVASDAQRAGSSRAALPRARHAEVPGLPGRAQCRQRPRFANLGAYAGLIELVCGLLIALGLFTRPAAFLASGTMAVAYWYAHAPQGFFPVNNSGDAAILYCFVFLYLVFAGPGPWSLDGCLAPVGRNRAPLDFSAHFLLYDGTSKRMPSHPHTVIKRELPRNRIITNCVFWGGCGFDPAQAAIFP